VEHTILWQAEQSNKGCVNYTVALPFTLKPIFRPKKNYGNSKNISPHKNIIFKKSSKKNQNSSRYYDSMAESQFQHKPEISSFKNPHIKIDLLPRGQNPHKLLYSMMNLNTISWPL